MEKRSPSVMISSTFYDLRQIRNDLSQFISEDLGYTPLLSELPTFPVDPDVDAIENCRRRVMHDADILILVIGGRYGSIEEKSSKSITNLEYLTAREKAIPIFAFVDRQVLPLVAVYKQNPKADLSQLVDNPRVLDFIDEIRSAHRIWTHEFSTAQDISNILRIQFSYIMRDGLEAIKKINLYTPNKRIHRLHGETLKIALTKPRAWEYLLFAHALKDQIEKHSDLRKEHELELLLGSADHVSKVEFTDWVTLRLAELSNHIECINTLVNIEFKVAVGPLGQPGDEEKIIFVAERLGDVYRHSLEWAQKTKRASVEEAFVPVIKEFAKFVLSIITCLEELPMHVLQKMDVALKSPESGASVNVNMSLDIPNVEEFSQALRKAMLQP